MIDTTNRQQLIERELSSDHAERREYATEQALQTARTADPERRAQLAQLYRANGELLRLRAARVEAERAFRAAHDAWHAADNTTRGSGRDGRVQAMQAAGIAVLPPWTFDQVDDPAELRRAAETFDGLAKAAR